MRLIVIGAKGGLGSLIVSRLSERMDPDNIVEWDVPEVDITDLWLLRNACSGIGMKFGDRSIYGIINAAGVNTGSHFDYISTDDLMHTMEVNAFGIVYAVQQMIDQNLLENESMVLNIVSDAAHKPMRTALAYCASKAAALMVTKCMARELYPKHGINCFSVSPNKLSGTPMSEETDRRAMYLRGWTKEQAYENQVKHLAAGRETDAADCAAFIADLAVNKLQHRHLVGCDIPFGG